MASAQAEGERLNDEEGRLQQLIDGLDDDELAILAESVMQKYEGNAAVLQVLTRKPPRGMPADENGDRRDAGEDGGGWTDLAEVRGRGRRVGKPGCDSSPGRGTRVASARLAKGVVPPHTLSTARQHD